ncbi:MAG: threonylcarbamoyl-AMP synthase [Rhodospirillales bacterium]|nr:threonylcarbamoyl-AMP synthase [Rhodospirillales bacterium]MCB9996914.1 threonylcarbamoyl-AMP synthase [Rhodospirillales bacterium]
MQIKTANADTINEAAALLKAGGLVVLPTETVYGLGANALDGQAVARIFEAKGRPQFNPLIVHVPDIEAAAALVELNEDARRVAGKFWPGPLTLILPRREDCPVSELCSAGLPTLAVRVPAHPVARAVLQAAEVPIAAPSANRSGHISPTTPKHAAQSLGEAVDMILAAGVCDVGLESTVLDLSGPRPAVLRPGAVSAEEIAALLDCDVSYETEAKDNAPKSPGQLLRHYAPGIPVRLNAVDLHPGEALLAFGSDKFMGIKGGGAAKDLPDSARCNLSETADLHEAAANLFRMLHDLDHPDHKAIAVMPVPEQGLGRAINDRLKRAAAGAGETI